MGGDKIVITFPAMFPAGLELNYPVLVLPYTIGDWLYSGSSDIRNLNKYLLTYFNNAREVLEKLYEYGYGEAIVLDKVFPEGGTIGALTQQYLEDIGFTVTKVETPYFYKYHEQNFPSNVKYVTFRSNIAATFLGSEVAYVDKAAPDSFDGLELAIELRLSGSSPWASRKFIGGNSYSMLLTAIDSVINLSNGLPYASVVYEVYDELSDEGIARRMYAVRDLLPTYGLTDIGFSEKLEDYISWVQENLTSDIERKRFLYKLTAIARGDIYVQEPPYDDGFFKPEINVEPESLSEAGELMRTLIGYTCESARVDLNGYFYVRDTAFKPFWLSTTSIDRLETFCFQYALIGGEISGPAGDPLPYSIGKVPSRIYSPVSETVDVESLILSRANSKVELIGSYLEVPRALQEKLVEESGSKPYRPKLGDPFEAIVYTVEKVFPEDVSEVFIVPTPVFAYPIIPLAKHRNAPVLLTEPSEIPESVTGFLIDHNVEFAWLVGEIGVIGRNIVETLSKLGIDFDYIRGENVLDISVATIQTWLGLEEREFEIKVSKPKYVYGKYSFNVSVRLE